MRGIQYLHPQVREKADKLTALCKGKVSLLITETWRPKAEQDALYAQGRTTPGKIVTNCKYPDSPHCWGVAFDFCKNLKGHEYDDAAFFREVGSLAKTIGLFWGGDFKSFVDTPHLEDPAFLPGNSVKTLQAKYGTPEAFKASWPSSTPQPPALTTADCIDLFMAKGIIDSPDYWLRQSENILYMKELYAKLAAYVDDLGYDGIDYIPAAQLAIDRLAAANIISNPQYWKDRLSDVPYLDIFFVKFASAK